MLLSKLAVFRLQVDCRLMTMMTMIIVRVTMAMGMVTVMMFIIMMLEIVLIYLVKLADHGE